jgi:hypothetical protein
MVSEEQMMKTMSGSNMHGQHNSNVNNVGSYRSTGSVTNQRIEMILSEVFRKLINI